MKRTSKPSAFFNPRFLLALSLCAIAVLLAGSAFARFGNYAPDAEAKAERSNATWTYAAKLAAKRMFSAVAGKVTTRATAAKVGAGNPATSGASTKAQTSAGPAPRITDHTNELGQTVYTVHPSAFDISPPLTELAKIPTAEEAEAGEPIQELPLPPWRVPHSDEKDPVTQVAPAVDSGARSRGVDAPSTGFNFLGLVGAGSYPSDNNGAAGNDQYVETVNTRYQVWSLDRANNVATSLLGPSSINTLWANFGGPCQTQNSGDPIVLYDKVANRWLIAQFTSSASGGFYYQCVAISTTANAVGTYYRYAFAVPNGQFGDYPHYGVWTDAYYVMAHGFASTSGGYQGAHFGAMDRTKMLAGDSTATWQVIIDPLEGGHMPADLDGHAPPPGGAPGIFASVHSGGMYLYRMKVDFNNPANTTRPLQAIMPVASASAACGGGNCIPQPGTTVTLDSLADRLMYRLAYRNLIDHESLVVSHSVNPGITGLVSGVRWYDFRISGTPNAVCSSYPCTYQQGTVADVANGRSRWMPSVAMDGAENIILGYSATGTANGSDNHSVRYTSRAKGDPLGTMTGPETIIFTGTRNMSTTPGRWGDYSSMAVDPANDCTLWYVNQYYVTGDTGNGNWKTRIASSQFPAGTGAGQCQPLSCTARPASAPGTPTVEPVADNQMQVSWVGISPTPGSYAVERATGAPGSEGLYQPVGFVAGGATNFVDTTVQGGVTYSYRVIAATDAGGRCQSLLRSPAGSGTATGTCNLKPTFAGATSASSSNGASCGVTLNWTPAQTSCPLSQNIRYNIYRGTTPNFTPAASNRIARCVAGPNYYVDSDNLTSGNSYYYVVRAEDNTTGNGGPCGGGNEETNTRVVAGTPYGSGTNPTPGTWTDGGGDGTAFLGLNVGTAQQVWRYVKSSDDPGANHTSGGSFAYRNAGPGPGNIYQSNTCAAAETPTLTVGGTTVNLTYWERHQLEQGWDGIVVEFSRNGGAWTVVPVPNNVPANGCMTTDVITDWQALSCTGAPPVNACHDPAAQQAITGPVGSGNACANWTTGALTAYGRRCHTLVGLAAGDTIKFRWRFTSDPAAEFAGFYLDDIAISNIRLPNSCTTVLAPAMTGAESRLAHGTAGTFSVNLPIGGRAVEPRRGAGTGAGRDYTIVVHFDREVNSGTATLTGSGNVANISFSGSDMIVSLTGVTDKQTVTLNLSNVTTPQGGMLSSAALQIGFLIGDVNADGFVQSGDTIITRANSGVAVTGTNFRADVTADGSINVGDTIVVRANSGSGL